VHEPHQASRFLLTLGLALCAAWSAQAQSPLGGETRLSLGTDQFQNDARLAAGADGEFTVAWTTYNDPEAGPEAVVVDRFSSTGQSFRPVRVGDSSIPDYTIFSPIAAPVDGGGFSLFYTQSRPDGFSRVFGRSFSRQQIAEGARFIVSKPLPSASFLSAAAPLPSGGFFIVAEDNLCPIPCHDQVRHHLFVRALNARGRHASPYIQVDIDDRRFPSTGAKSLAVDATGTATVVWAAFSNSPDPQQTAVLAQRFSSQGERKGGTFLVNEPSTGKQISPSVAANPNGDFEVVWQYQPDSSTPRSIRGRRFSRTGKQLDQEFVVVADEVADSLSPSIAADAQGNFVVVWTDVELPFCPFVKGRLFRSDGRPVGPAFFLTATTDNCDEGPQVAFGPQGVLAATWRRDLDSGGFDIYAARFLASPGDEPCLVRGGQVLCFTPTSGGEPVLTQAFGGRPGEVTLIGDFDGDGRADLCTRFGTTFACDLRHYGTLSDGTAVSFSLDSDIPLLGDIDGDGKTDLCVYRSGQFLCDTTRQGGDPNVTIPFGLPTDIPLLGDIDGDGKADPCVYRAGVFLCDTTHQGAAPNVSIPFGQPGDQPALGDIDGDGKADPCVLHAGHLLCDTTHRGGKANVDINLHARPGDRLILGNLDGL
jgi:hypothetical protein